MAVDVHVSHPSENEHYKKSESTLNHTVLQQGSLPLSYGSQF